MVGTQIKCPCPAGAKVTWPSSREKNLDEQNVPGEPHSSLSCRVLLFLLLMHLQADKRVDVWFRKVIHCIFLILTCRLRPIFLPQPIQTIPPLETLRQLSSSFLSSANPGGSTFEVIQCLPTSQHLPTSQVHATIILGFLQTGPLLTDHPSPHSSWRSLLKCWEILLLLYSHLP